MSNASDLEATASSTSMDGADQPQLLQGTSANAAIESTQPHLAAVHTEQQVVNLHATDAEDAKKKRHQVRRACAPCARAKRKCAGERPCPRCVELKKEEQCVDVVTKAQKKRLNSDQPARPPKKRPDRLSDTKGSKHAMSQAKKSEQSSTTTAREAPYRSVATGPSTMQAVSSTDLSSSQASSQALPFMQTVYDLQTGVPLFIYFNHQCLTQFNLSVERLERNLRNREEIRLVHPEDAETRVLAVLQAASQRETKYTFTCRFLRNITKQGAYTKAGNAAVNETFQEFEMTELNQLYTDTGKNRLYRTVWGLNPHVLSETKTIKSDTPLMSRVAETLRRKVAPQILNSFDTRPMTASKKLAVKDVDYSIKQWPQFLEIHFKNPALADQVLPVDRLVVSLRPQEFQVLPSSDNRSIYSIERKDEHADSLDRFHSINSTNEVGTPVTGDHSMSVPSLPTSSYASHPQVSSENAIWLSSGQDLSTQMHNVFPSSTSFSGNGSSNICNSRTLASGGDSERSATTLCSSAVPASQSSLLNVGGFDFEPDSIQDQNGDILSGYPLSLEDINDDTGSLGCANNRPTEVNWGTGVSIKEPTLGEPSQAEVERVSSVSSFDSLFGSNLSELNG